MQSKPRQGVRKSTHGCHSRAEQIQTRRFALAVCALAVMIVATAAASYASRVEASPSSESESAVSSASTTVDPAASLVSATYTAELSTGGNTSSSEDPIALLTLCYDSSAQTVSYKLDVKVPLANPSIAAICKGDDGFGGSTVFTIYPGPTVAGNFSGVLAQGMLSGSDLVGPLRGARLIDLVMLVDSGGAYAMIGTADQPIDAVRGPVDR